MHGVRQTFNQMCRKLHKLSHDRPSDTLKRKVAELEKKRKRRHPNKDDLYVDVPESRAWLDTATMPMILTAVGTALFAKILMMVLFKFIVLELIISFDLSILLINQRFVICDKASVYRATFGNAKCLNFPRKQHQVLIISGLDLLKERLC